MDHSRRHMRVRRMRKKEGGRSRRAAPVNQSWVRSVGGPSRRLDGTEIGRSRGGCNREKEEGEAESRSASVDRGQR